MSREVYQVFPAPTLQLIRPHLSLSEAPLSLRLRFSFSLMRFWNLSHAVCCLSACHCSFAHRQIWGVCVFCQAVDYSRPRDWCSLFNMFTCKTRFVGAAAVVCVAFFSPPQLFFPVIAGLNIQKWGSFRQVNTERKKYLNLKVPLELLFLELSNVSFRGPVIDSKWSREWFKEPGKDPAEVSHQPHAALHHEGIGKTPLSSLSGKIKVKISLKGKIRSVKHVADDAALLSLFVEFFTLWRQTQFTQHFSLTSAYFPLFSHLFNPA